jgi:hypothetical protein
MAEHIKVTLEHHLNRRYHAIRYGAGRRPAAVIYGKFNLRYRDPMLDGGSVLKQSAILISNRNHPERVE